MLCPLPCYPRLLLCTGRRSTRPESWALPWQVGIGPLLYANAWSFLAVILGTLFLVNVRRVDHRVAHGWVDSSREACLYVKTQPMIQALMILAVAPWRAGFPTRH